MSQPVKIAIVLEGGCLQAVLSGGVPVDFVLIDYDTEGSGGDEIVPVPQGGDKVELAHVTDPMRAEYDGQFVIDAHKRFDCGMLG